MVLSLSLHFFPSTIQPTNRRIIVEHTDQTEGRIRRAEHDWDSVNSLEEIRRVALGVTPQGSHRSGRAQLRHPVRPVRDSLFRFAIGEGYVNPQPRDNARDGWPPHRSLTDIPLPSPGSPRYRFPCFVGTMKMCDSRRPSHRASFPSLGDTRRRACRFAPCGPERTTAGPGLVIRSPLPDKDAWRRSGPPKFLGNPDVPAPCSQTPARPTLPGHYGRSARPHAQRTARALHDR
jgi:hypothetical protein